MFYNIEYATFVLVSAMIYPVVFVLNATSITTC